MVLLFAEHSNGALKKPVFEAATYAVDLAQAMGVEAVAVSVGQVSDAELEQLGQYGIGRVYKISDANLNSFANAAYSAAVAAVATQIGAKVVVMAQSYSGRAVSPRLAVKLNAAAYSGAVTLPEVGNGFASMRFAFSGKGVENFQTSADKLVVTVKANGYYVVEKAVACAVENFSFSSDVAMDAVAKEIIKASEGISLTEAELVVSAGRGMKAPENWGIVEELAQLLGAATACSKPTADMGWRPHHEHVGQTGIQIAPNLYIAIGISGAIQHLAGVSSSKTIVVINKDAEAPFFKIADYGIVGDLFDVVPKLTAAIRRLKG
ncbi:MAG: electron transfer flavoprotein subunit alpha/FixB family protein [Bacteroidia bacterium]